MRSVLLPLVMLAACHSSLSNAPFPLGGYTELAVHATDKEVSIIVGRGYSLTANLCPLVDENLAARLNGIPVPLVTRGGDDGGGDAAEHNCDPAVLTLDMPPPDGPLVLEVSDPGLTITCQSSDLQAGRTLVPIEPEPDSWAWQAGQDVTLQWAPSGDRDWPRFRWTLAHVNAAKEIDRRVPLDQLTVEDDLVHMTIPPISPGIYLFELEGGTSAPCHPVRTAASIYTSFTAFGASHPITIVP